MAHGSRLTAHAGDSVQFSIIVPVYNCEKYLVKCLESLCNQDIFSLAGSRNYEIIITDDGSTDKSREICDSYAAKLDFIHVTHTKNRGAAHARNVALTQAKGDYILFCDSDDYVSPQIISILTRAVELDNKADMFVYKFFKHENSNEDKWPVYDINSMKISDLNSLDNEELCYKIFNNDAVGGYLWNKVYKRDILQEHNFDENIPILEDQNFLLEVLCAHKNMRINCMNYYLYYYVQRSDFGQTRDPKMIYDKNGLSWFIVGLEKELTIEGLSPVMRGQIEAAMYHWATGNYYQMGNLMTDSTRTKLKSLLRKYALKYYFKSGYPLSYKIRAFIRHILITFHIYKYK